MRETTGDSFARRLIISLRTVSYEVVQHRYFIPACFVVAFMIRVGWVCLVDAQPVSDFRWYYERGIDFAAGRGYSVGPTAYWPDNLPPASLIPGDQYPINGRPTAYWPVGYPAFLGLLFIVFGPSLFAARIANVFLYMGVLFLSYYIARKLFASELTGRMTLLILSFYPNHIAYTSMLASEILLLFLLLLGITLLIVLHHRLWLAIGAGVVFGLACLVKPQVIFLPALFFAAYLVPNMRRKALSKNLTALVIVYISLGITILPWQIRNYKVFNDFVFISNNSGINSLVGNNPYATGAYVFNKKITAMLSDTRGEHERDVKARTIAVEYIVNHPLEVIELLPKKFWHLYNADREAISRNEEGLGPTQGNKRVFFLLKGVAQLYYMLIVIAFLVSIVVLPIQRRNRARIRPFPTVGLWIVLYFTGIYLLTFGYSRFHFPMMPWIVMYVGALAETLIRPEHQVPGNGEQHSGEIQAAHDSG